MIQQTYRIEVVKDTRSEAIFHHPNGFETKVLCFGTEQLGAIRGRKFGAYRPDLIIMDDLEDDVMVRNPILRDNTKRLFEDSVLPALDREVGQIVAIGTILHDDCLMAKLVSADHYTEFYKLFYRSLARNKKTGELESLWPEKWSVKDLLEIRKTKPEMFAKEYQGNPVSGSLQNFSYKDFRYWKIENGDYLLLGEDGVVVGRGSLKDCKPGIGIDLAWEEGRVNDYTVVMPGLITPGSDILICDYFCEKGVKPDYFEEVLFSMEERMRTITGRPVPIGFEKRMLEKVMKWQMKQAMKRRNKYLIFKDISVPADKISRIVTVLQPRYKQGAIYHKKGMRDLEEQLIRIPSGTFDDLPDAENLLVRLFESAPVVRKSEVEGKDDPGFTWLLDQVRAKKKKPTSSFVFGKTRKLTEIPAKQTWR